MADVFLDLRTKKHFSLDEVSDFSVISSDQHTLLQEAIVRRKEFAKALIERGIDLNHQDRNGQTALQYALARSESNIVHDIIEKGGNPNLVDQYGNNALWTAIMNPKPDYEIIEALIKAGADPHHTNKAGRSVVDMAKTKNNNRMLQLIGETPSD